MMHGTARITITKQRSNHPDEAPYAITVRDDKTGIVAVVLTFTAEAFADALTGALVKANARWEDPDKLACVNGRVEHRTISAEATAYWDDVRREVVRDNPCWQIGATERQGDSGTKGGRPHRFSAWRYHPYEPNASEGN